LKRLKKFFIFTFRRAQARQTFFEVGMVELAKNVAAFLFLAAVGFAAIGGFFIWLERVT